MPASQQHIGPDTPMGCNLAGTGASFRVWAPRALQVYVCGNFGGVEQWQPVEDHRLLRDDRGYWAGFIDDVRDGDSYKFWVKGLGSEGFKRDPYARELSADPPYPNCDCIVRDPDAYAWHDAGYRPPAFNDLVVYQLHVGTFFGPDRAERPATFLDLLSRLPYLAALGVNAIEPLPLTEFASPRSMGYDGSDLFSPEMDYWVSPDAADFPTHVDTVNALLAAKGQPSLASADLLSQVNQLKVMIDLCHLYGLAVIFDVVYNHAGGQVQGQDESLWFFDRMTDDNPNDSLYFTDRNHTGPVFALWQAEVRQFLIDNAAFFAHEYHADGFRYDQVSVLVSENTSDGWRFCQDMTSTIRTVDAGAVQVAEYWGVDPTVVAERRDGGAGFDATWHDGLRESIRGAVGAAAQGRDAHIDLNRVAGALRAPGFGNAWRAVQYVESHDEVYRDREPRLPALADAGNTRSWYARSRSRVAESLILTAPGIPMLFMGQEFLEDKPWSDDPANHAGTLIWWEGLERGDKAMVDHLRFTQDLTRLRRRQPALRGESINVSHVHSDNRVLAYHRWLEGYGRDIVIVASLNESTFYDYALGFPGGGFWHEVFNSDVYDNWVNPFAAGNGGGIWASGPSMHGLPASASIVIPANSLVVFARDFGD